MMCRDGEKISVAAAATLLEVSGDTVHRLTRRLDPLTRKPYLRAYRPVGRRVRIFKASAQALKAALLADPDFWAKRQRRAGRSPKTRRES